MIKHPTAKTWEEAVRSLMDDASKAELVRACYFDLPLVNAAARYTRSDEWSEIRRIVGPSRGRATDIGAGNGIVSFALAQAGWSVVAVEPDPSNLVGAGAIRQLAADTRLPIEVREGSGENLPIRDGEVQLAIARQVLHHAQDLSSFLREIARVLSPGGLLLTARDHVVSGPTQLKVFLEEHPLHYLYGGENAFQIKEYRAAIRGAGLEIEEEIGSLSSVINFAPYSVETLRREIVRRLGPFRHLAAITLKPDIIFRLVLRSLSSLDRRPGRLVSFVCRKPLK